ncbi:MAG TPA: hypothetical protein VFH43_05060 [Candidatus Kapabacteria bacterium]|nr:hypothetical protein [Candidatus Kapabacteria bacterium]
MIEPFAISLDRMEFARSSLLYAMAAPAATSALTIEFARLS